MTLLEPLNTLRAASAAKRPQLHGATANCHSQLQHSYCVQPALHWHATATLPMDQMQVLVAAYHTSQAYNSSPDDKRKQVKQLHS